MNGLRTIHASCVARDGAGVLLLGPPGSGKSDLALRLLSRHFVLVADDQVAIDDGVARPAPALAGLLEVRGLGIVRLAYVAAARLALAVELDPCPGLGRLRRPDPHGQGEPKTAPRLPGPRRHPQLDLPVITIDPFTASAADRVALALDCALGLVAQPVGAFAP